MRCCESTDPTRRDCLLNIYCVCSFIARTTKHRALSVNTCLPLYKTSVIILKINISLYMLIVCKAKKPPLYVTPATAQSLAWPIRGWSEGNVIGRFNESRKINVTLSGMCVGVLVVVNFIPRLWSRAAYQQLLSTPCCICNSAREREEKNKLNAGAVI